MPVIGGGSRKGDGDDSSWKRLEIICYFRSIRFSVVVIAARVRSTTGGYVFTGLCLFRWGEAHLHPIIVPLVPCPFWGYPSDWSQVLSLGVPLIQDRMGYSPPPQPEQDEVFPWPGLNGVTFVPPPPRDRLCLDRLWWGRYTFCSLPQEESCFETCCSVSSLVIANSVWRLRKTAS